MSTRRVAVTIILVAASLTSLGPVPALADHTPKPDTVAIPGTLQSELGCPGDWMPACEATFLTYDAEYDVWQGTFTVEPNNDQDKKGPRYKAAINGDWGENYGANAAQGGADIPLVVTAPTEVKFYYDHKTHWVTDNFNTPIVVARGNFQTALGCAANDDPGCLRSWMQDPEGSGTYAFVTTAIPAGDYWVELGINEVNAALHDVREFTVKNNGDEIYFGYTPDKQEFLVSTEGAPRGSLAKAQAHWVNRTTFLWDIVGSPNYSYALAYAPDGGLTLSATGVEGGSELPLMFVGSGPGGDVFERFPHLKGYSAFILSEADAAKAAEILKGQVVVLARGESGKLVDVTGVQIPGVLDDIYHYDGPLGVTWEGSIPTLRVWAPTAISVSIQLFDSSLDDTPEIAQLTFDPTTGVWAITGAADWKNQFYLYAVEVFVPQTGQVEHNVVTDPYSLSLSTNSERSQIVDLNDAALKPPGWDALAKPPLAAPEDSVIYELHIRDFSAYDASVPEERRGTFKAFTLQASNGMKHLAALAQAGLTHVHLLPAFDIATIEEDRSQWQTAPEADLAALPPDSDEQALLLAPFRDLDGFNWGYDPYHYTVPEGSYATNPDGPARILEFREMVQSLNATGLRVVMDVVYNHTNSSGQDPRSVLDKIVPGYYYRLNEDGEVERSTCCENTATEHWMMEKLMIDSVKTWATAYKVDGFRFDLMGHHLLSNMVNLRGQLDALTPASDGVDGKAIYLYGEGWDFGEVANNARGLNASQLNIGGSGIGVFNDRLRDGVRGGNPFDPPTLQGFATGLFLDPNAYETRSTKDQQLKLLEYTDWIKLGLAGNLAAYELVNARGALVTGNRTYYSGDPAGYTYDPQENIIYVSAHDNQTLFDAIQVKASDAASLADRVRMNNLALDLVMLSQGVPFFHAGDDLLRSKSFDRNSYNSGDWFNRLDFTYQSNNFGVGLPPEGEGDYGYYRPLLADPALKPTAADIAFAVAHFRTMLAVRHNTPLFRLQTAEQVRRSLTFLNTGPDQVPGLIVMQITDVDAVDPDLNGLVVLFNANPEAIFFADAALVGADLNPYEPYVSGNNDPALAEADFDGGAGAFTIPARTTLIYAMAESGLYQPGATTQATEAVTTPAASATPAATAVAAPTATPTPAPAEGSQPTFYLNLVAVGIAVIGILGGLWLLRFRRPAEEETEAAPKSGKSKNRKRRR